MKITELNMTGPVRLGGGDATGSPAPSQIPSYVPAYMKSGILSPQVFREIALGGGPDPSPQKRAPDDATFGTHIREAVRVLGRRPKRGK